MPPLLDELNNRLSGIRTNISALEEERLRDLQAAKTTPTVSGGEALAGIIFSALPTLLGYAIGGNQGGALGAQAGGTLGSGYLGNVEKRGLEERERFALEALLGEEQIKQQRSELSSLQNTLTTEGLRREREAETHDRTLELTDIREGRADARSQASRDAAFARLQDQQEFATQLSDRKNEQFLARPKSKPRDMVGEALSIDANKDLSTRVQDAGKAALNALAVINQIDRIDPEGDEGFLGARWRDIQATFGPNTDAAELQRSVMLNAFSSLKVYFPGSISDQEREEAKRALGASPGVAAPVLRRIMTNALARIEQQINAERDLAIQSGYDIRVPAFDVKKYLQQTPQAIGTANTGSINPANLPPPGSRERLEYLRRLDKGG